MSEANPRAAIAALLPEPIRLAAFGVVVRPVSLAQFALLERIDSPLLRPCKPGIVDLLPSLYVLTHAVSDSVEGDLAAKALAWADSLPPTAYKAIYDAVVSQLDAVIAVAPSNPVKKKPAITAGS